MMLYPWLNQTYQQITQAFSQQYGHHALLFRSENGLGIELLIEQIAAFLLCTSPTAQGVCHQCHACRMQATDNHPDFHRLAPLDDKNIGVEQVREISEHIHQRAQQGGNKVVLIQGAHRLTESAANALLKTLEEPPQHTYFLLQTDSAYTLPATIYSRCQQWHIATPDFELSCSWLQNQNSADTQQIQTALMVSHYRPLAALTLLEQGLLEKRLTFLRAFWLFFLRRSPLEILPLFDKEIIFQQIDWLIDFVDDSVKQTLNIEQGRKCKDLDAGIVRFAQTQTTQNLLSAHHILLKMRTDLKQISGVNQELILLDGLTRLITEVFEG